MGSESMADPGTSWWMRAEHLAVVVAGSVLALMHFNDIAWGRFIAAFLVIDLVGYLPGAVAFHRARGGPIARPYYLLYNLTHNYAVTGIAVALWAVANGGPEWAMLAVPIHLSGDRSIFGNFSKPLSLPFERTAASQS